MPTPTPPVKPKFIQDLNWMQKTLAGVSGSMFVMALLTMIPWIVDIFKPDKVYLISDLRMYLALSSFAFGGFVGIPQLQYYIKWLIDFYEYYEKFKKFKGEKPEE